MYTLDGVCTEYLTGQVQRRCDDGAVTRVPRRTWGLLDVGLGLELSREVRSTDEHLVPFSSGFGLGMSGVWTTGERREVGKDFGVFYAVALFGLCLARSPNDLWGPEMR